MRNLISVGRLQAGEGRRMILSVALAAGATGAAIALLSTSGYLISRAAQRPMVIALAVTITAVRSFGIARAVLRYSERLASHELTLRQLARLRTTFFARLAPLVPGRLARQGRGELLARFVGDVDVMSDLYLRSLIPVLVAIVVIAGAAVAGALMLGTLGIVLAVALIADAVVSSWVADRAGAVSARRQAPVRAQLTGRLIEAIDGSGELALAGHTHRTVADLRAIDRRLAGLARREASASALAGALHALLSAAGLVAVLIVAIDGVHDHVLSGLFVAAAVFLFLGAREATAPLPVAAQRTRACATSAARLEEICAQQPLVTDPVAPASLPAGGPLVVADATVSYGPREAPVLEGLRFELRPGEHVALIGESGAGKTTLAELLVRFRDPVAGRVTLGGVDIRALAQDDLRSAVLLCGQDAHLFNTTVRENLRIGDRAAGDAELWRALAVVALEDWARALPEGLDTRVGQQGELVSGGQRQRLALARALLSPARFLLLDEPVAHLDPPLAERVMSNLLAFAGDRGVLVITHDTATLGGCDRVLRMAGGRLSEAGERIEPERIFALATAER
ncbi:MAG: thiol reductant ABC exporter subunit CydC [Solirubrobacteraceae bacterium]|jgi:thiol reductant ABC exporter CydC subunit